MEQGMSGQSSGNNGDGREMSLSSGISQIARDLIYSNSFISGKIKKGKASCDKCGSPFPAIHPTFIVVDEANEEILCYPCNYKRLGIDVKELYKSKRNDGELEALRAQNRTIQELKISRKNKKSEKAIKPKKEAEIKKETSPDLFSGSTE
jgi:hypothetical protein